MKSHGIIHDAWPHSPHLLITCPKDDSHSHCKLHASTQQTHIFRNGKKSVWGKKAQQEPGHQQKVYVSGQIVIFAFFHINICVCAGNELTANKTPRSNARRARLRALLDLSTNYNLIGRMLSATTRGSSAHACA